ncbi:MAG: type IV secretory system conjugative DNA transfer family protein, partial [Anaerolineae bacterium]
VEPVLLAIDEVPMLLKIPGIAEDIGRIAPTYRSRKLEMVVIIQALWQLAEDLKEQIWSLGNNIVFGVDDFQECYKIAQQLFSYNPTARKQTNPWQADDHLEPDRGQYLSAANWIQHLQHRQVIMKRYLSEGQEDPFVRFIPRTAEKPNAPLPKPLPELKQELLAKHAIPVKEALRLINNRKLPQQTKKKKSSTKRPTISTAR